MMKKVVTLLLTMLFAINSHGLYIHSNLKSFPKFANYSYSLTIYCKDNTQKTTPVIKPKKNGELEWQMPYKFLHGKEIMQVVVNMVNVKNQQTSISLGKTSLDTTGNTGHYVGFSSELSLDLQQQSFCIGSI